MCPAMTTLVGDDIGTLIRASAAMVDGGSGVPADVAGRLRRGVVALRRTEGFSHLSGAAEAAAAAELLAAVELIDDTATTRATLEIYDGVLNHLEAVRHLIRDSDLRAPAVGGVDELMMRLVTAAGHREQAARIVGVSERSLRRWQDGTVAPRASALARIGVAVRASETVGRTATPLGVARWWERPSPRLGGQTPLDVVGERPRDVLAAAAAELAPAAT